MDSKYIRIIHLSGMLLKYNAMSIKGIIGFIIAVTVNSLMVAGLVSCDRRSTDINYLTESIDIPEKVVLSNIQNEPDTSGGVEYKTSQNFYFNTMKEGLQAIDTPYVLVNRSPDRIMVRLSNDIDHPYIFTNYGIYWHCKWISGALSDSIVVDRFIKDESVYEYIQKKTAERNIRITLNVHGYSNGIEFENKVICENVYDLGTDSIFDKSVGADFDKILNKKNRLFPDSINSNSTRKWNIITIHDHYSGELTKQYYTYTQCGKSIEINYSFSPIGIYDDNKEMNRIKPLKRIM